MAKYEVWFENNHQEFCIGTSSTEEGARTIMKEYLKDKYEVYYYRYWYPQENERRYDFGSWSDFISIKLQDYTSEDLLNFHSQDKAAEIKEKR